MNKPELPDGQSLEEILANIRKTLATDGPEEGLSRLDVGEAAAMPDPATAADPDAAQSGDALPDQLAVALNGVPNGHADDEELRDLLASDVSPAPKPKADIAGRDPLWFLPRGAAEPVAKAEPEKIELTRPETLRRSFPPLFGNGELQSRPLDVPVERVKSAEPVVAKETREPDAAAVPKPLSAGAPAAMPQFRSAKLEAAPFLAKPVAPEERAAVAETSEAADFAPVVAKTEPVAVKPEPIAEAKPAAEANKSAIATPASSETKPATDAGKDLQGQALQDVIARLLEPVIKQWLDANLPRMVESAIREEVARQVKVPRSDLKI